VGLSFFFELALFEPSTATLLRRRITTLLVVCFGPDVRYFDGTTISINCNERQITRVGVSPDAGQEILGLDTHTDLHGSLAYKVDARFHDNEVTEVNRLPEIDAVDRDGDDPRATMPKGRDSGALVHHRENDAAKHMAHVVGVFRHHEL